MIAVSTFDTIGAVVILALGVLGLLLTDWTTEEETE